MDVRIFVLHAFAHYRRIFGEILGGQTCNCTCAQPARQERLMGLRGFSSYCRILITSILTTRPEYYISNIILRLSVLFDVLE
jgi:hypothetical protein